MGESRRPEEDSGTGHKASSRKKEPKPTKGEKTEDELETTNSDMSGNEWKTIDSFRMFDSDEPNHLKAKQKRRQGKSTPTRRSRHVDKRRGRNN